MRGGRDKRERKGREGRERGRGRVKKGRKGEGREAVSYTHLTLPTILRV